MFNVTVDAPQFDNLITFMRREGRKAILTATASRLPVLCRDHLKKAAANKHSSAARLGVVPSGHLEEAAHTMLASANNSAGTRHLSSSGSVGCRA